MYEPKMGDIVKFTTSSHPVLGEGHPFEAIGRVQMDVTGFHAGGRYLASAIGEIILLSSSETQDRIGPGHAGSRTVAEFVKAGS